MKNSLKLILLSSVMMLWGAPCQAQTCATQPTCAELGYTLTSTTDCIGTVLKCPFDKTKYYCTQKTEVTAAVMPNYAKGESRTIGATYIAASDGYIFGYDGHQGDSNHEGFQIIVDGKNIRLSTYQLDWEINNWLYPIKKGSSYRVILGGLGTGAYQFVPLN